VGTFKQRIELAATAAGPFRGLYALVDTGSAYTWVPGKIIRELGLAPFDQYKFVMANGEEIKRDRAEAVIRLDGRVLHTICVLAEGTDQTLLGAYTLEGFALSVDPVRKRLVPIPALPVATDTEPEGGEA
jgi:clan AA aspartic protease